MLSFAALSITSLKHLMSPKVYRNSNHLPDWYNIRGVKLLCCCEWKKTNRPSNRQWHVNGATTNKPSAAETVTLYDIPEKSNNKRLMQLNWVLWSSLLDKLIFSKPFCSLWSLHAISSYTAVSVGMPIGRAALGTNKLFSNLIQTIFKLDSDVGNQWHSYQSGFAKLVNINSWQMKL